LKYSFETLTMFGGFYMRSARTANKPGGGPRAQLLDVACRAFAEKGFRDATVA